MSAIANAENRNSYANRLTDELIVHYHETKKSNLSSQKERINRFVEKILRQENSLYGCSKESLIGLRRVLFVLDRKTASKMDKKISETLRPVVLHPSERKLFLTRASWSNFWSSYDEFAKLFPSAETEEGLLYNIYQELLLKQERSVLLGEVVKDCSAENRTRLFYVIINNFLTDRASDSSILHSIKMISKADRLDVLNRSHLFFIDEMSAQERINVLEIIKSISKEDRLDFIRQVRLIKPKSILYFEQIAVLKAMAKIPRAEWEDVVENANSLLSIKIDDTALSGTIQAIGAISREERANAVEHTKTLVAKDSSDRGRVNLLKAVAGIPKNDRSDVISRGRRFFCQKSMSSRKTFVLKFIQNIPKEQRDDIVKKGGLLSIHDMTNKENNDLLNVIQKIDFHERAQVITLGQSLFTYNMNVAEKLKILETVGKIPQDERESVVEASKELFAHYMTAADRIIFLEAVQKIPDEERKEVVRVSKIFFNHQFSTDHNERILNAILTIPSSERILLEQKENDEIIDALTKFVPNKGYALLMFYLLPDGLKEYNLLVDLRKYQKGHIWGIPEYQVALIDSLEKKFANATLPPFTQIGLAHFIDRNSSRLGLHEEHPLTQQAIEIVTSTDIQGEKNPATIYRKLKKLRQEPSNFLPSFEQTLSMPVQINLGKLQELSASLKITRAQLPQEATFEEWKRLIQALKAKAEQNITVVTGALKSYGTNWTTIWNGSLNDPYLSGLLNLSCEKVPLAEAKFKAVLSNILAKENTRPDPIFTEQEDVLIKTAMSIQHCTGGKQEGIDGAYRLLDPQYQYGIELAQSSAEEEQKEKAIQFITGIIRNLMGNQVGADTPFMKELIGIKDIKQGSHQSIYVKNLIGHLIGLDHELVFDRHTHVLYDTLVEKAREAILEFFFKHNTPQKMISEVIRAVNADLANNSKVVGPLIGNDGWDLQDDDLTFELNARGALDLLEISGYLQVQAVS